MTRRHATRFSRRRVLAAAAATTGLAGCSSGGGGGGGGNGSGDGAGSTDDGTGGGGRAVGEIEGEVTGNAIDGIEVVGVEHFEAQDEYGIPDGRLVITVTIENTGSEEITPPNYDYGITYYDGDGQEVMAGVTPQVVDQSVAPGETGEVKLYGSTPENVARYEVAPTCEGSSSYGTYCE